MNNIAQYVLSLLPGFSKDRVLEDCRLTRTEIQQYTVPAYEAANDIMRRRGYESAQLTDKAATFGRHVKLDRGENMMTQIGKSFKPALENLDQIEKLIDQIYSEEVVGGGVTYLKANLLRYVECLAFASKYARKFLNYYFICETAHADSENSPVVSEALQPAEIDWLNANFLTFCQALDIISINGATLKKSLDAIPDVVVSPENLKTMSQTHGSNKLDPLTMGLLPVWLNPIYHIGMRVAEWQVKRHELAKEELKTVQLRVYNLQRIADGKPDANVQKQIDYYQRRANDLTFKIAKVEQQNG
jgi:hypothetical protein